MGRWEKSRLKQLAHAEIQHIQRIQQKNVKTHIQLPHIHVCRTDCVVCTFDVMWVRGRRVNRIQVVFFLFRYCVCGVVRNSVQRAKGWLAGLQKAFARDAAT